MKKLAISGHSIRGKEVIEIFIMLGGKNILNLKGIDDEYYYIDDTGFINNELDDIENWDNKFALFSLEEFLEKYPYKIGDRVRVPEYESKVCISKMYWDGNEVQYEVVTNEVEWYSAKELNEFNEPNKLNKEKKINQISLANCDLDEVEIVLGDKFELKIKDNKYYAIRKKPQYPKTYRECCEVLGLNTIDNDAQGYEADLIIRFQELLIARNAYWKIAGEQMGLGKPWSPSKNDNVYCIFRLKGEIVKDDFVFGDSLMLEFPTEEMRDAFYKNFKDLIKGCKNLI